VSLSNGRSLFEAKPKPVLIDVEGEGGIEEWFLWESRSRFDRSPVRQAHGSQLTVHHERLFANDIQTISSRVV
jgi:hypothetical protein